MDKRRVVTTLIVIYTILITTLSVVNFSQDMQPIEFPLLDKCVHFCFYFGLNTLLLTGVLIFTRSTPIKPTILVTALAIAYGVVIEFIQLHVGREFDLYDIVANSVGAIAILLIFRLERVESRLKRVLRISDNLD